MAEFALEGLVSHSAQFNPNLPHIISLCGSEEYALINLNTCSLLRREQGIMVWKGYDEYLRITGKHVSLCSLTGDSLLEIEGECFWDSASFNNTTNLFAVTNYPNRLVHVYTVESTIPLFIFNLQEDDSLLEVKWVESNGVDYLAWLTPTRLALYDLSLDSYSKVIDLRELQSNPSQLLTLRKHSRDENYLLCLGEGMILAYDVTNLRTERIELESAQSAAYVCSEIGCNWVRSGWACRLTAASTCWWGSTWSRSSSDLGCTYSAQYNS